MDRDKIINEVNCLKGSLITRLTFLKDEQLTVHVKFNAEVKKITFYGVFAFDDTGIVNTELQYFDINLPGFMNRVLLQSKGHNPEDYFQVIFINNQHLHKTELIIVVDKEAFIELQ